MSLVSNMGLEVFGEDDLSMANGDLLHTYVAMCDVALSEEDTFDVPIHICKSSSDLALIGMDILSQCNYSQWHEWQNKEHAVNFTLEIAQKPE